MPQQTKVVLALAVGVFVGLTLCSTVRPPRPRDESTPVAQQGVRAVAWLPEVRRQSAVSRKPLVAAEPAMHVAIVACGKPAHQDAQTLLSSALRSTRRGTLMFHLVTDDATPDGELARALGSWPWPSRAGYQLHELRFPEQPTRQWKALFKPCASQRLFFPELFPGLARVLYLDTDTLVLADLSELWLHFRSFNNTHSAAMVAEGTRASSSWYPRFARHPFYRPLGLNSGVMLMDLQRMRASDFVSNVVTIYQEYSTAIPFGDQDILNIYYADRREQVFELSCAWNFRPDHCMYGLACNDVQTMGVKVMHGNRGVFHNTQNTPKVRPSNIQPVFQAAYAMFQRLPVSIAWPLPTSTAVQAYKQGFQSSNGQRLCDRLPAYMHFDNAT
eukprot:m.79286 g.79286  ORF g.79286 m.79286 type:complete len:387 (-) comp14620_c0_seq2:2081-3241(-)